MIWKNRGAEQRRQSRRGGRTLSASASSSGGIRLGGCRLELSPARRSSAEESLNLKIHFRGAFPSLAACQRGYPSPQNVFIFKINAGYSRRVPVPSGHKSLLFLKFYCDVERLPTYVSDF